MGILAVLVQKGSMQDMTGIINIVVPEPLNTIVIIQLQLANSHIVESRSE